MADLTPTERWLVRILAAVVLVLIAATAGVALYIHTILSPWS